MTSERLTSALLAFVCALLLVGAWWLAPSFARTGCIVGAILSGLGSVWLFASKYSSR